MQQQREKHRVRGSSLEANQTKFRDNSERKARKKTLGQSRPKQTEKKKSRKESELVIENGYAAAKEGRQ